MFLHSTIFPTAVAVTQVLVYVICVQPAGSLCQLHTHTKLVIHSAAVVAGDKYDLVARQGNWGRGKSADSKQLLSGPQGMVAKQEREARNKKIRQKLVS